MSSIRFAPAIEAHPELTEAIELFEERLINAGISNIDPDTIDRYLGDSVPRNQITLLIAALMDAGVVELKLRIKDRSGNFVGEPFGHLSDKPEFADDRMLNRFEVSDDDVVPVVELVR